MSSLATRLLQRRYIAVAVASIAAIIAPIHIASTALLPGTGAPPPEARVARLAPLPLPVDAMAGRLFFAAPLAPIAPTPDAVAGNAAMPPPSPAPTLLGTATHGNGRAVAVLRGASGTAMLRTGEEMDGWRVTAIRNGTITIRNGDQSQALSIAPPRPTNSAPNQRERP